jgi:hypothetical protein
MEALIPDDRHLPSDIEMKKKGKTHKKYIDSISDDNYKWV